MKKLIALIMLFVIVLVFIVPQPTLAASPDWKKFRKIVIADVRGAVEGYLSTGSGWGALGGGVISSIDAALNSGQTSPGPYPTTDTRNASIGLHHNLAIDYILNGRKLSELNKDTINNRLSDYIKEASSKESRIDVDYGELSSQKRDRLPVSKDFQTSFDEIINSLDENHPIPGIGAVVAKTADKLNKKGKKFPINTIVAETEKLLADTGYVDEIAFSIAADVLEHSFEYWIGNHMDESNEPPIPHNNSLKVPLWKVVKADISGFFTGYEATESIDGAIAYGVFNSVNAATQLKLGRTVWDDVGLELAGSLHNEALVLAYGADNVSKAVQSFLKDKDIKIDDTTAKALEACGPDGCIVYPNLPWPIGPKKPKEVFVSSSFDRNLEEVLAVAFAEDNFDGDKVIESLRIFLEDAAKNSNTDVTILEYNSIKDVAKKLDANKLPHDIIYASSFIDMYAHSTAFWLGFESTPSKIGSPANRVFELLKEIMPILDPPETKPIPPTDKETIELELKIGSPNAKVNGKEIIMDVEPIIKDSRTLIPFRFIGEALNAKIGWDQDKLEATYELGNITLSIFLNETRIIVNGKEMYMDVKPTLINNRLLVPVRFVSEILGFDVEWIPEGKLVRIKNK